MMGFRELVDRREVLVAYQAYPLFRDSSQSARAHGKALTRCAGRQVRGGETSPEREGVTESVGELDKVARQVFGVEVLVCALTGALEFAQNRVGPDESGMLGALRSRAQPIRVIAAGR